MVLGPADFVNKSQVMCPLMFRELSVFTLQFTFFFFMLLIVSNLNLLHVHGSRNT